METNSTGRFSGSILFLPNKTAQKKGNFFPFYRKGEKSGASLYGNIATGGVINIISRKAISPLSRTTFTFIHPYPEHFHSERTGRDSNPERFRTSLRTSVQHTSSAKAGFIRVTYFYSIQPPSPVPPEKGI